VLRSRKCENEKIIKNKHFHAIIREPNTFGPDGGCPSLRWPEVTRTTTAIPFLILLLLHSNSIIMESSEGAKAVTRPPSPAALLEPSGHRGLKEATEGFEPCDATQAPQIDVQGDPPPQGVTPEVPSEPHLPVQGAQYPSQLQLDQQYPSQQQHYLIDQRQHDYQEQQQLDEHQNDARPIISSREAFLSLWESFMRSRGLDPKPPVLARGQVIDVLQLFQLVAQQGGHEAVTASKGWARVGRNFNAPAAMTGESQTHFCILMIRGFSMLNVCMTVHRRNRQLPIKIGPSPSPALQISVPGLSNAICPSSKHSRMPTWQEISQQSSRQLSP
jgi:hypothetical protein